MELMFTDVEGDSVIILCATRKPSRIKELKRSTNEHDQPTETPALDADGLLLSRILRIYDEMGRIRDIRTINDDDPTSQFGEQHWPI